MGPPKRKGALLVSGRVNISNHQTSKSKTSIPEKTKSANQKWLWNIRLPKIADQIYLLSHAMRCFLLHYTFQLHCWELCFRRRMHLPTASEGSSRSTALLLVLTWWDNEIGQIDGIGELPTTFSVDEVCAGMSTLLASGQSLFAGWHQAREWLTMISASMGVVRKWRHCLWMRKRSSHTTQKTNTHLKKKYRGEPATDLLNLLGMLPSNSHRQDHEKKLVLDSDC